MIIPLITNRKRLNTICNGMIGQWIELCSPERIHRPVSFEIPTYPFQKIITTLTFWDFNRIMQIHKTGAFFHEPVDMRHVRNNHMAIASIGIHNYGVGIVKNIGIFWPSLFCYNGINATHIFIQQLCKQYTSSQMFMFANTMTILPGN